VVAHVRRYFLVEGYLAEAAGLRSVIEAASQRPAVIDGTRHIGTVVIATEETCLSVFEASDPETVGHAGGRTAGGPHCGSRGSPERSKRKSETIEAQK
jgi:hypothetical protein